MIVIATSDFMIRKGLESILRENTMRHKIVSVKSNSELAELLFDEKPKLIYMDHSWAKEFDRLQEETAIILIELFKEKAAIRPKNIINHMLCVDGEEMEIKNRIKQHLELYENIIECKTSDSELSERETDILREVALGKTNKEIADHLFISAHTVITHRKNITRKLGIKTVSGLTVYAILNKIIQMEEM